MTTPSKKLGVIVAVEGTISRVGMYDMSNDSQILWYGDVLNGIKVGAMLTINQNDIKIIATVIAEKVIDQQNSLTSREFDNRYSKNSINRVVELKTKGVIENHSFQVTSSHVPMIGNEVTLTAKDELSIIYSIEKDEPAIEIGHSILENQPVYLAINKFFPSHIGIFGNTGSGKSNTLHKLYLELLRSGFREGILKKSQFFLIDFNGEYTRESMFSINGDDKAIFNIDTRNNKESDKISITKDYLLDADILGILFNATIATQVPFLRKAIKYYRENVVDGNSFSKVICGLYQSILTTGNSVRAGAKAEWEELARKYVQVDVLFDVLTNLTYFSNSESYHVAGKFWINKNCVLTNSQLQCLKLTDFYEQDSFGKNTLWCGISEMLALKFNEVNEIQKLKMFLDFQEIYATAWGDFNPEHIKPLFTRIENALKSLKKVMIIEDDISCAYKTFNIFSLVRANAEITRLLPMLLSKMFYDEQKNKVAGLPVAQTKHLIIDEAHNILNNHHREIGDSWQDYRMAVFEEIIKEGRKFGFYLTLSSQRPADISPTILSQVHNYLIHRLVNEKDLRMLENTLPTLDKNSFQMISMLGKGEAIVTGNALHVPIFTKIKFEEEIRPNSDDVKLTDIWEKY